MTSTTSTKATPATKARAAKAAPVKAVKAPAAKLPDAIDKHLAEALAKVEVGTFIKARDLTNAITKTFPKDEFRPSVHVIFNRCRTGRLCRGARCACNPCVIV